MKKRNIRITFRVSQEDYDIYKRLARSRNYNSVSAVVRNLLQCRITILKKILKEQRLNSTLIGDEIHQMFCNYEETGRNKEYPPDLNRRL